MCHVTFEIVILLTFHYTVTKKKKKSERTNTKKVKSVLSIKYLLLFN